jgi:hypothetical protein
MSFCVAGINLLLLKALVISCPFTIYYMLSSCHWNLHLISYTNQYRWFNADSSMMWQPHWGWISILLNRVAVCTLIYVDVNIVYVCVFSKRWLDWILFYNICIFGFFSFSNLLFISFYLIYGLLIGCWSYWNLPFSSDPGLCSWAQWVCTF